MGFLKNLIKILFFLLVLIFIFGCARSIIKIAAPKDDNTVSQFGITGERNFFIPIEIGDSLKLLWERDVHGSFNNSSFIFFDSTIVVHDLSGRIHTFNIHTGKQTGVLKFKGAVFSTPLVFGFNLVIALVQNNENKTELIFYDFFNGKELKTVDIPGKVINQMLKIENDFIIVTENGLIKRFGSRGDEIWSNETDVFIHCNPAYNNGKIFFGNDKGQFICINAKSGELIYKKELGSTFNSGVTIRNSTAYVGDDKGILYALNTDDGSIKWQYSTGSRILMNPAADENDIFVANLSGNVFSINMNNGSLNWQQSFNGAVFNSTPLITIDRIVIPNLFQTVILLDKKNGELKKEIKLNNRAKMTPAVRDNILFIGFDNGMVRAYEIVN